MTTPLPPLTSHDGRYLDLPNFEKAEALLARGATRMPMPRRLPQEPGYRYVVVITNPRFDGALILTPHELRRCWASIDAGDDRPFSFFQVPAEAFGRIAS
ncbi:MAG: hypothetical protein ACQGVC_18080 [Myxococcota bacterium]